MSNSMDCGECNHALKKIQTCDSSSDLISNLPEHIIANILICLPLQDAARTSLLSKNWRFKWISNPIPQTVLFDQYYFSFCKNKISKNPMEIWCHLCKILSIHKGPLHKFVLRVPLEMKTELHFIDMMMILLARINIQELTIAPPAQPMYRRSSNLFQCIHLTRLNLSCFEIRLPPQFTGFRQLITMELYRTRISADDFKTFICKCPLLQRLIFDSIVTFLPLEIDASNLKYLKCTSLQHLLFKNVPVLSTVIITEYCSDLELSTNIAKVFGSLPAIEHFSASRNFVRQLSRGVIPEALPRALEHLRLVELSGLCFNSLEEIRCAILLMKSSPKLQKLKITVLGGYIFFYRPTIELRKAVSLVDDFFNELQEVTMENFNGTVCELEFLKLVLAKSLVLKMITIRLSEVILAEKKLEILKAMTRLQRVSLNAEIIVEDNVSVAGPGAGIA